MRRLLDLNDLLQEELCNIYQAENKLLEFIDLSAPNLESGPLLDWLKLYRNTVEEHVAMVRRIFYQLFLFIEPEKNYVIDKIIKDYESSINRTSDYAIKEEELIIALAFIIHYKIASYGTLHIHTKALKYWDETVGLHIAEKEEKEMEANLSFLKERHHIFFKDWYSF